VIIINNFSDIYAKTLGISRQVLELSAEAENAVAKYFREIERIREHNQVRVIDAMRRNRLSDTHFAGSTGYGYGDKGREVLDAVFADIFEAEDALVRHSISSGTQALALAMFGVLRPGDELLSVTGKPYDTLEEVIGIRNGQNGSLADFGITYRQLDLLEDGSVDYEGIPGAINEKTAMVLIQRSMGYSWRKSLPVDEIGKIIKLVKEIKEDIVVLVDNCYGEFVEEKEPAAVGADLVAGSLIKNPGGGIAPSGGYIAGKNKYVYLTACRLSSPGLGKEVGPTLGTNRLLFQGLYMAPHVVAESLKGAVFCSYIMERLGFRTIPFYADKRSDIIQAIRFGNPDMLIAFCQGIQSGSAVDAFVLPEPWDMPGYDCPVIMASGGFIQGSSIELSADGPLKPPYIAYMQGGIVYESVKAGVLAAIQRMKDKNLL